MRRLCSRPGCSASATTVFGFDPGACAVWLGALAPDGPRDAGDLCDRHAATMTPPQGWALEDRRGAVAAPAGPPGERAATERAHPVAASRSRAREAVPAGKDAKERDRKPRRRRTRRPAESATAMLPFDAAENAAGDVAGSTVAGDVAGTTAAGDVAENAAADVAGTTAAGDIAGAPAKWGGAPKSQPESVAPSSVPVTPSSQLQSQPESVAQSSVAVTPSPQSPAQSQPESVAPSSRVDAESWSPRFDRDDDLDGLLDAKTPLLGRAFRNIRSA